MKRKAVLRLHGGNCASCAYTIEHVGRKIPGIDEVRVFPGENKVIVDYEGPETVLAKVTDIVKSIGYEASILETDAS